MEDTPEIVDPTYEHFVKPRMRIPPQNISKKKVLKNSAVNYRKRSSLTTFLNTSLLSETKRTAVWKTKYASQNDIDSYLKFKELASFAESNKRRIKENFKKMKEQNERQKMYQQRAYNPYFDKREEDTSWRKEFKPQQVLVHEATVEHRKHKEDSILAMEDAELKSTTIS